MQRCTRFSCGVHPGPDLPIGYISLSLGSQDPRGPPANCGNHSVNCRYMIISINNRQSFYVLIIHKI